jgi:hypothetical protein
MSDDSDDAWWKTLGAGLFCLGVAVFLFYYFSDFEASGGSRRINAIVAALYNLGGKWLTCSVFGIIGIALIGKGIKEFKDQ